MKLIAVYLGNTEKNKFKLPTTAPPRSICWASQCSPGSVFFYPLFLLIPFWSDLLHTYKASPLDFISQKCF